MIDLDYGIKYTQVALDLVLHGLCMAHLLGYRAADYGLLQAYMKCHLIADL